MESMNSNLIPSIPEWFQNRNVLVTGSTGFLGKVFIIKLLQSCPDIGRIYLLIREKRGMDPYTRLQQMCKVRNLHFFRPIKYSNQYTFFYIECNDKEQRDFIFACRIKRILESSIVILKQVSFLNLLTRYHSKGSQ